VLLAEHALLDLQRPEEERLGLAVAALNQLLIIETDRCRAVGWGGLRLGGG
jgi:hypothetical protein